MFIVALVTIAKKLNELNCSSWNEWLLKSCTNGILFSFKEKWNHNLKKNDELIIIIIEVTQFQKGKIQFCVFFLKWTLVYSLYLHEFIYNVYKQAIICIYSITCKKNKKGKILGDEEGWNIGIGHIWNIRLIVFLVLTYGFGVGVL